MTSSEIDEEIAAFNDRHPRKGKAGSTRRCRPQTKKRRTPAPSFGALGGQLTKMRLGVVSCNEILFCWMRECLLENAKFPQCGNCMLAIVRICPGRIATFCATLAPRATALAYGTPTATLSRVVRASIKFCKYRFT